MSKLLIDSNLCTRCRLCGTVCVMGIIDTDPENGLPRIPEDRQAMCLRCGHCEAFCPQHALTLDFAPESREAYCSGEAEIEARRLGLYMKQRRSIRRFENRPVDRNTIMALLDIARYAPSAGNSQTVQWLVIHDPQIVRHIAELVIEWMRTMKGSTHPMAAYIPGLIAAHENGHDPVCRNAPHLLFAHLPKQPGPDNPTDALIALTHFELAAPAFGVGACWAGFIKMAMEYYPPLIEALALPDDRKAVYGLLFGYPVYKPVSIPARNPLTVTWR